LAKIREIVGEKIPIHTFTIAGSERYPDYRFARDVATRFKTIHHDYIPSMRDVVEAEKLLYSLWPNESFCSGNAGVFLIYKYISQYSFKCSIAHDGIDELLGGYWEHRQKQSPEDKEKMFNNFWGLLEKDHLLLLERKARNFDIEVVLPYLQKSVVEYITAIPINDRTSFEESKIPLRDIAQKFLPQEIIERRKKGFCSALDKE
jgi:asparagine synthetase B (glutamine-hydrolysing)